jgi:RimJ/RimL family protein N-acetyltransferase
MKIVFETERLLLRLFTIEDAHLIYDLNKDPAVTKFTHDPVKDMNHAKQIIEEVILPQYSLYNFGRWAIHLKQGQEFIGWCGLKYRTESKEIDLGYRLKKEFWGKGFATEAALGSMKHGFGLLKIKRIVGCAEPENRTSCLVLEKCGMKYIGEGLVDGYTVKTYEISRNDFKFK